MGERLFFRGDVDGRPEFGYKQDGRKPTQLGGKLFFFARATTRFGSNLPI